LGAGKAPAAYYGFVNRQRHFERQQSRRQLSGVLLCLLVVVFAVAAKASWYRVHPPAGKAIASMKAAKADTPMVESVTHDVLESTTTAALLFAALAAFFSLTGGNFFPAPEQDQRPQTLHVRRAFARPPPVR
jgi:hypothetical protein